MTNVQTARKSVVAIIAAGVVVFSLTGLDASLTANAGDASATTTRTTAQA